MKTIKKISLFSIFLIAGIVIGRCSTPSGNDHSDHATATNQTAEPAEPEIWTCSMHPQVQSPNPGDCPICGMDLIPLDSDQPNLGERSLILGEYARKLAEIETSTVKRDFPTKSIRLVGELNYDRTLVKTIAARFPGRIDALYLNFIGAPVKRGEHLALIYSPEIITAQEEYINAYQFDPNSRATTIAGEKLLRLGLLPEQIESVRDAQTIPTQLELKAPIGGIVTDVDIVEGEYVNTGSPLFQIADLRHLWLEVEAYEQDLPWIRQGQKVTFTVEALPGEQFTGRVIFIDPVLNEKTRTTRIRIDTPNTSGKLKPGMFAAATIESTLSSNGVVQDESLKGKWISPMHPSIIKDEPGTCDVCGMDLVPFETFTGELTAKDTPPLLVPTSAVLKTGNRAVVYLETLHDDQLIFEGREILLGAKADDDYLVIRGLNEGDKVVTKGAFKLDSELQIQAKPNMMTLPSETFEPAKPLTVESLNDLDESIINNLLTHYLELQNHLQADDLDRSKEALHGMINVLDKSHPFRVQLIDRMVEAESIDDIRRPHFEDLSNLLIAYLQANPEAIDETLYIMNCPMVYDDRGADWIQNHDTLLNPYFGASMLRCGSLLETLTGN